MSLALQTQDTYGLGVGFPHTRPLLQSKVTTLAHQPTLLAVLDASSKGLELTGRAWITGNEVEFDGHQLLPISSIHPQLLRREHIPRLKLWSHISFVLNML